MTEIKQTGSLDLRSAKAAKDTAMENADAINLSPFFSYGPPTIENTGEYWSSASDKYEVLEDGWVRHECTTTSSTIDADLGILTQKNFIQGEEYTILLEWRNFVGTGGMNLAPTQYGTSNPNRQFSMSSNSFVVTDESPTSGVDRRFVTCLRDASNATRFLVWRIHTLANSDVSIEIRVSMYKGRYYGGYRPYVDQTLRNRIANNTIGGRNLLRKTGTLSSSDVALARASVIEPGVIRLTPTSSSTGLFKVIVDYLDYKNYGNGVYTVSFDARIPDIENPTYTTITINVYVGYNISTRINEVMSSNYDAFTPLRLVSTELTTEWKRFSTIVRVPYHITGGKPSAAMINGSMLTVQPQAPAKTHPVEIRRVKLELGDTATEWTPAPEDIETDISSIATVANAAASKETTIKRTQRIYYRSNSSTKPTTPGTTSSNWITQSGDVDATWTTMHVPITSTHKYIYTCEQSETNAGVVGYTTVLRDNTITVIDGGNIITGTVNANAVNASSGTFDTANIPALTADHIKANVISAVNGGTGTINADKINAANLSIGYSQITNPPTIPTQSSIDDAAKTATNYISAGANGIKISDSNPGSATTYQQLTSTSTEFITNGISTLYIGSESNVSIVRVGSSTKGNIVLSGDGYVDVRSGSTIISHFGYESLYGEDDGTNPRVKSNYPYYTLGTRYTSNPSRLIGGFSVTLGKDCVAEEWCSIAMGHLAWAEGYGSIALGGHASGGRSISMCPNSVASGGGSIAIGSNSQATSDCSVAIGCYAKATGLYSHAIGYYTEARGVRSIVGGDHSNAFADGSMAIGRYCKTESTANYSVALGYNSEAKSEYQTVIGKNNTFDTNGTYAFIIGGGSTPSARTNIFTVDWSGNVVCNNLACNSINKVNDIVMVDREYPSSGSPSNSTTSLGTSIGGLYDRLYIEATDAAGNTKWIVLKGPFVNGTTYQFNIAITGVDKDVGLVFRTKTFSITTSTLNVVRNGNGDYKYGRATLSNSGTFSWSYSNEVHITKVVGVRV